MGLMRGLTPHPASPLAGRGVAGEGRGAGKLGWGEGMGRCFKRNGKALSSRRVKVSVCGLPGVGVGVNLLGLVSDSVLYGKDQKQ